MTVYGKQWPAEVEAEIKRVAKLEYAKGFEDAHKAHYFSVRLVQVIRAMVAALNHWPILSRRDMYARYGEEIREMRRLWKMIDYRLKSGEVVAGDVIEGSVVEADSNE